MNPPSAPSTPPRKVRLKDVAARAGVSINTVSRAIRAPHTVRPQLRRHIESVLEALDYVPNRLAGGLAGSQSGVVGVIVTSLFYSEFAALLDALQTRLGEAGLTTMLGNNHYSPDEELRLARAMLSWRPAAMALIGADHHPRAVELLQASGVPVVELWEVSKRPIDSVVGMDHRAIGRAQTRHLLDNGYRRIAFVACLRPHDYRAKRRAAGYAEVVRECSQEPLLVTAPEGGSADLGERLLHQLLERSPEVDGIVCNSDVMAFGVLRGLARRGRRVPREVGVIGFGDNEASACTTPALSTVRPPRREIGLLAAEIMLARIEGGAPASRMLEALLVPRASSDRRRRATRAA